MTYRGHENLLYYRREIIKKTPNVFFTAPTDRCSCKLSSQLNQEHAVEVTSMYMTNITHDGAIFTVSIDSLKPPCIDVGEGQIHFKKEYDSETLMKLKHDLSFLPLSDSASDEKLGNVFKSGPAYILKKSPDLVRKYGKHIHVLEHTTRTCKDLTSAYDEKYSTYQSVLQSVAESNKCQIRYDIFACNSSSYITSLRGNPVMFSECCKLYVIAEDLLVRASTSFAWAPPHQTEALKLSERISAEISSVKWLADSSKLEHPEWAITKETDEWCDTLTPFTDKEEKVLWEKTIRNLAKQRDNHPMEGVFEKWLAEHNGQEYRNDMKSVLQMPMIDHKYAIVESEIPEIDVTCRVFNKFIRKEYSLNPKGKPFVTLSKEETKDLSEYGIFAKSYKHDLKQQLKRDREHKIFNFEKTDVSDIDSFILSSRDLLEPNNNMTTDLYPSLPEDLLLSAQLAIDDNPVNPETIVRPFATTIIGRRLLVLQLIMQELSVNAKTFAKQASVNFREICPGLILAFRSMGPSKPIFYSVATCNADMGSSVQGIAKKSYRSGDWTICPWVSADRQKISHLLHIFESALALYYATFECFGYTPVSYAESLLISSSRTDSNSILKHFMLSLLVYLEDKAQTSTALQTIRYGYMELIRNSILKQEPLKIFDKITTSIRSRLLIWILRRYYSTFLPQENKRSSPMRCMLIESEPKDIVESDKRASKVNAISFVDGQKLSSLTEILFISYMGYHHNKNEGDLIPGLRKILVKVIKEEVLMENIEPYQYRKDIRVNDPDYFKSHAFNARFVNSMGELAKKEISKNHAEYYDWVERSLSMELAKKTAEEFATVKKSSFFMKDTIYSATNEGPMRTAALGTVCELVDKGKIGDRPYESFKTVADSMTNRLESLGRGADIQTFKKPQIGGDREIMIADMETRVIAHFLETLSRLLCEEAPEEMMTKGNAKLSKDNEHYDRLYKELGLRRETDSQGVCLTLTGSEDAERWCQRFVMIMFYVFMRPLVPPKWRAALALVLNMTTYKKIQLPKVLLDNMVRMRKVKTQMKEYEMLKAQFLHPEGKHNLINFQSYSLKNLSNMMQGFLHYTSSLYHWAYFKLIFGMINKEKGLTNVLPDSKLVCNFKVSSDDSEILLSLIYSHSLINDREAAYLLTMFSLFKETTYSLAGLKQSIAKSTSHCFNNIVEFNSYWTEDNNVFTPMIKYIVPATTIPATENMVSRQRMLSEMRSKMLESGASMYFLRTLQYLQGMIHYSTLGSIIDPTNFLTYSLKLSLCPHAMLGYYVFEPSCFCGLGKFAFAEWLMLSRSEAYRQAEHALVRITDSDEVTEDGRLILKCDLKFGENKKFLKFISALPAKEYDKYFDEKPEELWEFNACKETVLNKLIKKAHSPGIPDSFGVSTPQILHSTSVYILTTDCLTVKDLVSGQRCKMSLIGLVDKVTSMLSDEIDQFYIDSIFPDSPIYSMMRDQYLAIKDYNRVTYNGRFKNKIRVISLPESYHRHYMGSFDALGYYWGMKPLEVKTQDYMETISKLLRTIPWLRPTINESLTECMNQQSGGTKRFEHVTSMTNFLKSVNTKSRKMTLITRANMTDSVEVNLKNVACQTAGQNWDLEDPSSKLTDVIRDWPISLRKINSLHARLTAMASGPETVDWCNRARQLVTYFYPPIGKDSFILDVGKHLNDNLKQLLLLSLIQSAKAHDDADSIGTLEDYLNDVVGFEWGYWSIPQKFTGSKWIGDGVFNASINRLPVNFYIKDDKLDFIQILDRDSVALQSLRGISTILNRLKIERCLEPSTYKPKAVLYYNMLSRSFVKNPEIKLGLMAPIQLLKVMQPPLIRLKKTEIVLKKFSIKLKYVDENQITKQGAILTYKCSGKFCWPESIPEPDDLGLRKRISIGLPLKDSWENGKCFKPAALIALSQACKTMKTSAKNELGKFILSLENFLSPIEVLNAYYAWSGEEIEKPQSKAWERNRFSSEEIRILELYKDHQTRESCLKEWSWVRELIISKRLGAKPQKEFNLEEALMAEIKKVDLTPEKIASYLNPPEEESHTSLLKTIINEDVRDPVEIEETLLQMIETGFAREKDKIEATLYSDVFNWWRDIDEAIKEESSQTMSFWFFLRLQKTIPKPNGAVSALIYDILEIGKLPKGVLSQSFNDQVTSATRDLKNHLSSFYFLKTNQGEDFSVYSEEPEFMTVKESPNEAVVHLSESCPPSETCANIYDAPDPSSDAEMDPFFLGSDSDDY